MARLRKGVTLENLLKVDRYFYQAIKDNRLDLQEKSTDSQFLIKAKDAFKQLPSIDWKNEKSKALTMKQRREALQQWIDQFISQTKWQRCLLTLRQNKSRRKLKLKRLDLQLDVYLTVKTFAKKSDMTIGEAIYSVVKPALDKIYRKEYNKSNKSK